MKKILIILIGSVSIIIVLGVMLLAMVTNNDTSNYENILVSELDSLMEQNTDYQYVDVRTESEYNKGHIDSFQNIEDKKILANDFSLSKETPVVLICRSGNRSANVADFLTQQGYEIINVKDGIINYKGELQ